MANPGSEGEHKLQRRHGTEDRAQAFYRKQMLTYLNDDMRRYIARQEMVFIATSDSRGDCDCSFRGGLPGFVHVWDKKRLAFPEYRGNGV
ncbi:MAG: pyridoxamine 5-phosphate oxidase, partial [Planctomycetes bacterium]|nr:pyridoxamine 5-phosphate oxidase [Planctomycetota bacterium]